MKDIETKTLYSEFDYPVAFQGKVFFTARDGKNAGLLWSSDGSEGGTRLVEDFDRVAKVGSGPDYETAMANNLLFFTVYDQGMQLWRTDGTEVGGLRLTSLPASYPQIGSHGLTAYINKVYFFNDAAGYEALWVSGGSREDTHLLTDFSQTLVRAEQPVVLNRWIYFLASGGSQTRLYRSDGTIAGTTVVRSWEASKINNVSLLVLAGNRLFFTAWDNDHGQELWVSDGTPAGTRLYSDVTSGQGSTNIKTLIAGGNSVFFVSQGDSNTWTLWKSTAEGRAPVRLLERNGVTPLFPTSQVFGRYLYFTLGSYVPRTLWRTDGTPAGTIPLNPETDGYFTMEDFNVIGDRAYFNATDAAHGAELWTSDGTPEGTRLAFDLLPGPDSSNPEKIAFVNGALWFRADDGLHGSEPWMYDLFTEHFYLPVIGR